MASSNEFLGEKKARKRKSRDSDATSEEFFSNGFATQQFPLLLCLLSNCSILSFVLIGFKLTLHGFHFNFQSDYASSDLSSTLRNICTCFGIGGLNNAKKRKIETKSGILEPLTDEWNLENTINILTPGMKKRYTKEMSEMSFQLLGLIKRVSQLFKNLHKGRTFLKDITMDIYLKDVKVKPSLPLPEQYVEIGLWRQIMQINQKICHKMEELEKVEGSFPDDTEENSAKSTENDTTCIQNRSDERDHKDDKKSNFRDYYMEMVTSNFGDELDKLRQEGGLNSRKVEILINCLETGKDIWSDLEKGLLQSAGT